MSSSYIVLYISMEYGLFVYLNIFFNSMLSNINIATLALFFISICKVYIIPSIYSLLLYFL